MRKHFLSVILICVSFAICTQTYAQFTTTVTDDTTNRVAASYIRKANLQKTGNRLDVFTNFFQTAIKDLTGENRTFEFKSTLFALRLKLDPSLNIDTNYVKHSFDRNFQFNTSLKLDTQFKFNGFSAGFTWAVVNKRDSTILSFIGTPVDLYFKIFSKELIDALNEYKRAVGQSDKFNEAQESVQNMLREGKFDIQKLPFEFKKYVSDHAEENFNKVDSAFKQSLADIRLMPLLTFSVNSLFSKGPGIFNGGDVEIVYLQGLSKNRRPIELDVRGNFKAIDTTINNKRYRTELGFTGGFNWSIIISRSNNAPLVEIKPHIEYKRVLRGLLPNEDENVFLANAEARVRITPNLWIPFTLKYDLANKNFLGFLNISINWDAFKLQ